MRAADALTDIMYVVAVFMLFTVILSIVQPN